MKTLKSVVLSIALVMLFCVSASAYIQMDESNYTGSGYTGFGSYIWWYNGYGFDVATWNVNLEVGHTYQVTARRATNMWTNDANLYAYAYDITINGTFWKTDMAKQSALVDGVDYCAFNDVAADQIIGSFVATSATTTYKIGCGILGSIPNEKCYPTSSQQIDWIRLTDTTVPEPGSMLVLGMGMVSMLGFARRRK